MTGIGNIWVRGGHSNGRTLVRQIGIDGDTGSSSFQARATIDLTTWNGIQSIKKKTNKKHMYAQMKIYLLLKTRLYIK